MNFLNLMPWWAWILCGLGGLFLARLIGRPADEGGNTVAEIIRMILGFAGIVGIVVGILLFIH
jgi:hypothetical protein